MPTPMIGTWDVEVLAVRPFAIHGDLYYELHVADPGQAGRVIAVRVPRHAMEGQPQAGERYVLTFLMGQVTGAKRASS
jgi:hypothetical protein